MFRQNLCLEEINSWWDNSITWFYVQVYCAFSQENIKVIFAAIRMMLKILCSPLSMKWVYEKLKLMWLSAALKKTLQAITTFIIHNKNKDTKLQIILRKLEIFCFPFIKKKCLLIPCTFIIISTLAPLCPLPDEYSGEGGVLCDNQ